MVAVLAEARNAYLGRSRDDWSGRDAEVAVAARLLAGHVRADD